MLVLAVIPPVPQKREQEQPLILLFSAPATETTAG